MNQTEVLTNLNEMKKYIKNTVTSSMLRMNIHCETKQTKRFGTYAMYKYKGVQVVLPLSKNRIRVPIYFTADGTAYILVYNPEKSLLEAVNYISWKLYNLLLKSKDNAFLLSDVENVYGTGNTPNLYIIGQIERTETGEKAFSVTSEGGVLFGEESLMVMQKVGLALNTFEEFYSDYLQEIGEKAFYS